MALDPDEARKISRLARLNLGTREAEATMVRELGAIVEYFDQLSQFEADPEAESQPATSPDLSDASREAEDRVGSSLDRRLFEANAPEARDGFLVVPRIKAGSAKA